ncbi:hypothetical protein ABT352_22915 [Streptosporangium sp. NPDC000563]|uniref:hypothetical protein n=1 Tax=Streptosporangium sp. NPDC000563 TaxID=3154366 RepID=UPI003325262E
MAMGDCRNEPNHRGDAAELQMLLVDVGLAALDADIASADGFSNVLVEALAKVQAALLLDAQ